MQEGKICLQFDQKQQNYKPKPMSDVVLKMLKDAVSHQKLKQEIAEKR